MTTIVLDHKTQQAVRRFNRLLAYMPRFKMRTRLGPVAVQSLLRVSQLRANGRVRAAGIEVEQQFAEADGLRVPVRILRPSGQAKGVVLDIHGGGWVIGNPQMNDAHNVALVKACQFAVVSVDYRMLPRFSLLAAMDDCLAAANWLLAGGVKDLARLPIFLLGESAGAHLAATVLQRLAAVPRQLSRIAGTVLYYGVYDLGGTPMLRAAGADTLVLHGPGLAQALCMLMLGCDEAARRMAPYSPLYGDLAGMPPALMFAGERDPLLEDTTLMATRWREAADVELHVIPDAPHGYLHFPTPLAQLVAARTHAWLNEQLAARALSTADVEETYSSGHVHAPSS